MDIQVAQPVFDAIDVATKTEMGNVTNVMSVLAAVIGVFWMMQIGMKSLYWYFDGITGVLQDSFMSIGKASCIMFMAFSVPWYVSTIVPVVTDFPVWLGNTIAGVSSSHATNLVDGLINSYIDGVVKLSGAITFSTSAFKVILALVFYLLGGVPFLSVAVGTLITLKAATTLIMVLGPIFIALSIFPQTRQYFWGWVGVIGGFMLTQALFSVVMGIEISYVNANVIKSGGNLSMASCFAILLIFGAFTILATEIPNYAASIMGGSPGGTGGVGGILSKGTGLGTATRMSSALIKKLPNRNRIK